MKRLFDVFDINLKNKSKRKVKERKVKEGIKRREASYCFSLLTEEIVELSYEHRCKVMTIEHRR